MATKTTELSGIVSVDLTKSPELPDKYETVEASAKAYVVDSEESYNKAAKLIQLSAAAIAKVEAFFEGDRSLAHKLHASICAKVRTITAPWAAVRPALEPKMRAYRQEQDRLKRAEEDRLRREQEAQRLEAEREAKRIQAEADAAAAELKRSGDLRAARAAEAKAAELAQAVVAQAEQMAEVGVILPEQARVPGLGESRKWKAREVVNEADPDFGIMQTIKAIAAGQIPLRYLTPVFEKYDSENWADKPNRKKAPKMKRLIDFDQAVLNEIGNRLGRENIGIQGCEGFADLGFRVSKAYAPDADAGEDW